MTIDTLPPCDCAHDDCDDCREQWRKQERRLEGEHQARMHGRAWSDRVAGIFGWHPEGGSKE